MATAISELPLSEAGTDIAVLVANDHSVVLFDQEKFDAWYDRLKENAPQNVDITTNKGRDILRSYSADIRKEKAAIDRDRLKLTKEWRDMTAKVNEAGKQIESRLEALADEVRQPLTDWEDAEKARVIECDAIINRIVLAGTVTLDDTADTVRARGKEVWDIEIDAGRFGDKFDQAAKAKAHVVELLKTAFARLTKEEADRAELEKLRAENAEREARETAAREAREAEEKAAAQAKAEEDRRASAEKAEADRIARVEQEAAERAIRAAEAAAQAERDRIQREHAEQLAAERARAEEAERKEAARIAEEKRIAAEDAARAKNRAHRSQLMGEAKLSIMAAGNVEEAAAVAIVKAIVASQIPHVSLAF